MAANVCVFCASSQHVAPVFLEQAREMGRRLAEAGHDLVYGGGAQGLMGEVARGALERGGWVTGIYPVTLFSKYGREIILNDISEIVEVETMHQRKAVMAERADAFVALPGGFGTLEEIIETIAHRQLGLHHKPNIILNTDGFYDALLNQFERCFRDKLTPERYRDCYERADSVEDVLRRLRELD